MSLLGRITSGIKGLFGYHDPVLIGDGKDEAMIAAIEEARATLPIFWARYEAQDRDAYLLKVKLETPNGAYEHLWMTVACVADDGSVAGVLTNKPLDIDLCIGSSVVVTPDQITDWSYWKGQTLYGNFTSRVLAPFYTRAERAELLAVLSEEPIELEGGDA